MPTSRIWTLSIVATIETTPSPGPLFSSATYGLDTLTVTFTNVTGSLQNQSDTSGWAIVDGNGSRTVISSTGTSDTVTLTLDQILVPPVYVYFCPSYTCIGGAPSLADTGTPPKKPEPFYEEVSAPWWDPLNESLSVWSVYQPKGSGSLAESYVDLSGNGNNASPTIAPSWNSTDGWIFSASQYLELAFTPAQDRSQTVLVQYTNGSSGCIFGSTQAAAGTFSLYATDAPVPAAQYGNGGITISSASAHLTGNLCVAGENGYKDGSFDIGYSGTLPYIGAMLSGIAIGANLLPAFHFVTQEWRGRIQAFALYDEVLTATQIANIAAGMVAL